MNPITVKQDLQLKCYSRAIQKKFDIEPKNIKAVLQYVDDNEIIGASFTKKSLENAEKLLKDAYLAIERKNPEEVWGKTGEHCQRCDYSSICPFNS